ncbi:MAG: FoF1 ATP synthase subunit gamma, partial [Alphaproteobacteria bacterium]|nr:FoF1 ATP synthase subunit gamma [Alphaproteobacteria bacterium]
THFKNALTLKPMTQTLVPMGLSLGSHTNGCAPTLEPSSDIILPPLLMMTLKAQLYAAGLDAFLSEQAARMSAMEEAKKNAEEMVSDLKTHYNRTRQSMITRELIEIIAGSESFV